MERIAHRELRNRSSEILRAVAAGETFEITNHGEVVAVLSPPDDPPLRIIPATVIGHWDEIRPVVIDESIQDILDDLRGER